MPLRSPVVLFIMSLVATVLLVPSVMTTVAQPWQVHGVSMEPSIHDGSVVLVDALGPRIGGYQRGDIVIVTLPADSDYPHPILVKRIVAVAGDRVLIVDGEVQVNGIAAAEPYLAPGTPTLPGGSFEVTVPVGDVFVMGDHRADSYDSVSFGPVSETRLGGRAWIAIGPGGDVELPGVAAATP